jgi:16S rRNA (cytosine967-C5)-methyltransferase
MRPGALEQRLKQQAEVLDQAVTLLKPQGRIVYITCSMLAVENDAQVNAFLARHRDFTACALPIESALGESATAFDAAVLKTAHGVLMTPRRTQTDGFFVSILRRES